MAYSDAFKTEALILLAQNRYDFKKTAEELQKIEKNLTVRTLRNWEKNFPKNSVPELIERALGRLLMHVPPNLTGRDWGVAVGILADKYLILQGQPTSRVENLVKALENMSDKELNNVEELFQARVGIGSNTDKS